MVNRIATFAFTNNLIADNLRLQVKYGDVNTQISSGLKTTNYKGIARDSQRLLNVETSQSRLQAYSNNGVTVKAVVDTMYESLGRMDALLNTMIAGATTALGGDILSPTVTQAQAQVGMSEMAALLNLKMAGRYVYAGSDIDTQPVDLADPLWTPQVPPSVVNSSYYQGNTTINSVQMSETLTVNYGILASNPAFERGLRAYNLIVNNSANKVAIAEALGLLQQSVRGIADIRGALSANSKTIEDQTQQNDEDIVSLKTLITNIKHTDIASASVELQEVQLSWKRLIPPRFVSFGCLCTITCRDVGNTLSLAFQVKHRVFWYDGYPSQE
jgi:flagellar hook-associated protein 3 FlgL